MMKSYVFGLFLFPLCCLFVVRCLDCCCLLLLCLFVLFVLIRSSSYVVVFLSSSFFFFFLFFLVCVCFVLFVVFVCLNLCLFPFFHILCIRRKYKVHNFLFVLLVHHSLMSSETICVYVVTVSRPLQDSPSLRPVTSNPIQNVPVQAQREPLLDLAS